MLSIFLKIMRTLDMYLSLYCFIVTIYIVLLLGRRRTTNCVVRFFSHDDMSFISIKYFFLFFLIYSLWEWFFNILTHLFLTPWIPQITSLCDQIITLLHNAILIRLPIFDHQLICIFNYLVLLSTSVDLHVTKIRTSWLT